MPTRQALTYLGPLSGFEVYNGVPYNVKVTAPDVAGASEYGTFLVTYTVEQVFVDYVVVEYLHDSYQGNGGANQLLGPGFWIAPYNMGDNPLTGDCNNPKVAYDLEFGCIQCGLCTYRISWQDGFSKPPPTR